MHHSVRHTSRPRPPGVWCAVLAACAGLAVAAPQPEPLASLRLAAEQALRARVAEAQPDAELAALRIDVGGLDNRLRLARCAATPEGSLPPGEALRHRTVIKVSCAGPQPWSVQLPVTLEVETDVLVLERPLPRGAEPRDADVRAVRRRLPGLASAYLSRTGELGSWRLRRPLDAGAALAREALEPAPVVRRGQTVTLVSQAGGIDVRATGEALADAAPGQRVRIRNLGSLKIVDGLAVESGQVRVGP